MLRQMLIPIVSKLLTFENWRGSNVKLLPLQLFYVQDIPAADEVLILSLFQGSCLIVSERGVIRGVGLGRLKIKTCCVRIE